MKALSSEHSMVPITPRVALADSSEHRDADNVCRCGIVRANFADTPVPNVIETSSWEWPFRWSWPPYVEPIRWEGSSRTINGKVFTKGWPVVVLHRVEECPPGEDNRLDATIAEATSLELTVTSQDDKVAFEGIRKDNGAYVNFVTTANKEHNTIHFSHGESRIWTYKSIPVDIVVGLAMLAVICFVTEFITRRREGRKP